MKSVPSDSIEKKYDPSIREGVHSANILLGVFRIIAYLHIPRSSVRTIISTLYISSLSYMNRPPSLRKGVNPNEKDISVGNLSIINIVTFSSPSLIVLNLAVTFESKLDSRMKL